MWALFTGAVTVIGVVRSVAAGSVSGLAIVLLLFGVISVFDATRAVLGKPLIMIDADEFTDCRSGRTVA
jgi:hypothetical protein